MRHALPVVSAVPVFLLFIGLAAPAALAQSDEAYIEYRQKVMGSLVSNMGSIGDILKNRLPLQDNIVTHAENVRKTAELIVSAFEKRVTEGKTDAKPEVWTDRSGFEDAAQRLMDESAKLVQVAQGSDMKALVEQVQATGKSCGGCHDNYRVPKEQSYKRR